MLKAIITLFNIRRKPIKSGYRPLFLIKNAYCSGIIFFDKDFIYPEEECDVLVDFLIADVFPILGEEIKVFESPSFQIGKIVFIEK